jgi:hypothetical protein
MADETKFTEGGAKMLVSVAMFAASAIAGTMTGIGAIGFIAGVVGFMTSGSQTVDALKAIKKQIDDLRSVIVKLEERVNELAIESAQENNRQDMARLNDNLEEIGLLQNRLNDRPDDVETAVQVANELGVIIDRFLRTDFEMWRWTDVVEKNGLPDAVPGRFKNVPTLPVYILGVLTWLAAREPVVRAGQRSRLVDDAARVTRHLQAVSVRDTFDKYGDGEASRPTSIAEHIKWRIRAFPVASTRLAQNRICSFFFDAQNWMNGDRASGDPFDVVTDQDNVVCTIDPRSLGTPNLELDWEREAGVEALLELAGTLDRVERTGTARQPLVVPFPATQVFLPSILYFIAQNGELHWYRNERSSQPGGSNSWDGPKVIGTGFQGFTTFFNGGGKAMYGVQRDGTLLWFGFNGIHDGSPNWLNNAQPKQVGTGWGGFKQVFPGGESIIYGIQPDGSLLWFRHIGAGFGGGEAADWAGPNQVAVGWGSFVKVFSSGEGVIYAIDASGTLFRAVHKGFRSGAPQWEQDTIEQIATGWNFFFDVAAGEEGVIYGFTRDGRGFYTRYGERRPGELVPVGSLLGLILAPPLILVPGLPPPLSWEGPPVEVKRNIPGFLSVFSQMPGIETGVA